MEENRSYVDEFLELLYSQVDRGIYVWGGNGENLSDMEKPIAFIERHEEDAKDEQRAIELFEKRVNEGIIDIRAFDCSGLVYWALNTLGLQKDDVSSRGLYRLCEPIEQSQLRRGDLVFHHDGTRIVHVGVWTGDGDQIECKGRDVGVVLNKRRAGYWNRFGRWKAFEDDPGPSPEPEKIVYVKGGSVNVRSVDYVPEDKDMKKSTIIGVAHHGNKFPLIGVAPSGWYNIDYKGQSAYISNRADLTELR